MKINAVNNLNTKIFEAYSFKTPMCFRPQLTPPQDTFIKSNIISFGGKFETMFPANFLNKILKEGVNCAYSDIPLIPKEDYRTLCELKNLNKPIRIGLDYLNLYVKNLYSMEQKVLKLLNSEGKKHPNKTIADLLISKHRPAEKTMRLKQIENLNKLLVEARELSEDDFTCLRYYVIDYIKRLSSQNPQGIILDPAKISKVIKSMSIQDKKLEKRLLKIVDKIPTEDNSLDAYIYEKTRLSQNLTQRENEKLSAKISTDLLSKSVASNEHFYPQAMYRVEEKTGKHKGEPFRVSFLTSQFMNKIKRDMPPDEFIGICEFDVPKNLQKQLDRLIEIHDKWKSENKIKDANKLVQYILALKLEAEKRSKLVKLNIDKLTKTAEPEKMKEYTALIKNLLDIKE